MKKKSDKAGTRKLDKPITVYVVKSQDGQYFRSKGYGHSHRNSWVNEITKAKFYGHAAPAKAQITFWAKNYPTFGTPVLVEVIATSYREIPQEERVVESVKQKKDAATKRELRRLTRERDEAQAKLEKLTAQGTA